MQIPACSHGGSHFALGSKTNPTATPRGASEPAEQTPTRANKAANSTVEPTEVMSGLILSQLGRVGNRQKAGADGEASLSQVPRPLQVAPVAAFMDITTKAVPGECPGVGAGWIGLSVIVVGFESGHRHRDITRRLIRFSEVDQTTFLKGMLNGCSLLASFS